jgi:hypothetical protein
MLYACTSPSQPAKQDAVKDSINTPALTEYTTLDAEVPFAGIWVNEEYIDKIKRSKSPVKSQHVMQSCIMIPNRTLQITRMISGFHEGGADVAVGKNGDQYLLFSPKSADSIQLISSSRIKIKDHYFIKLEHGDSTRGNWGILEEILFKGHYKLENGKNVEFTEDGKVDGLDDFTSYIAVIDYAGTDTPSDVSLIQLGKPEEQSEEFGYRFAQDTLYIYKTQLEYDKVNKFDRMVFAEQEYKLIKVKS